MTMCVVQADKQMHLSSCLEKLMTDVQRNLEPKNRDKFTQVAMDCICFLALFCSASVYVLLSKSNSRDSACLLTVHSFSPCCVHAESDHCAARVPHKDLKNAVSARTNEAEEVCLLLTF